MLASFSKVFRMLMLFAIQFGFAFGDLLEVACPPFVDGDGGSSVVAKLRNSNNDYCQCSLTERGASKTAILKCEFDFEKDIILKGKVFPFGALNVTSAYVRMRNAKSAIVTADFLSSWMDAPSSALDLWHCGHVTIEQTPQPHPLQLFTDLKTFVGIGIIDCVIENIPSSFLRDRSRGAFRLKNCKVGKISAGIFHNIEEMRYMNIEDSFVGDVSGSLSSSGVITLSKKEIHSWDGVKFSNSSFQYVAPFSFNVTHLDEIEKFDVANCSFEKLDEGAISATGDINLAILNNSFNSLASLAIQASVKGKLSFSRNTIKSFVQDSLHGLECSENTVLLNNTFYVMHTNNDLQKRKFPEVCGSPKVSYIISENESAESQSSSASPVVIIVVLLLLMGVVMGSIWGWKNRVYFRFHYRRRDIPLWRDERAPDGEEDNNTALESTRPSSVAGNPTYYEVKMQP